MKMKNLDKEFILKILTIIFAGILAFKGESSMAIGILFLVWIL